MMSQRVYRQVAEVLAGEYALYSGDPTGDGRRAVENIAASMADLFKRDNPRFDRERFYRAALGRATVRE